MASKQPMSPLYCIRGLLLLDATDGSRIVCKYFGGSSLHSMPLKEQKAFERKLWSKTARTPCVYSLSFVKLLFVFLFVLTISAEIILFDTHVIVYKIISDVIIYVLGAPEENEILLASVLNTLYESLLLQFKLYTQCPCTTWCLTKLQESSR